MRERDVTMVGRMKKVQTSKGRNSWSVHVCLSVYMNTPSKRTLDPDFNMAVGTQTLSCTHAPLSHIYMLHLQTPPVIASVHAPA